MTIKRAGEWGVVVPTPSGALAVGSDAELAEALERREPRALVVRGGDLHRAVGARRDPATSLRVPIDVLRVEADGQTFLAVAHVVVGPPAWLGWWTAWRGGRLLAVMNAEHIGAHDVAPRAHPNDGRFDVVEVSAAMPARARLQAWRRLATGTHVPHPDITTRRGVDEQFCFAPPGALRVDGRDRGLVRSLSVRVEPDAAVIHL